MAKNKPVVAKIKPEVAAAMATIIALLAVQKKIKNVYAYEKIKGEGYGFYVCFDTNRIVKVRKGKTITRLTESMDSKERYLVYAENQRILIPKDEIEEIGYY